MFFAAESKEFILTTSPSIGLPEKLIRKPFIDALEAPLLVYFCPLVRSLIDHLELALSKINSNEFLLLGSSSVTLMFAPTFELVIERSAT